MAEDGAAEGMALDTAAGGPQEEQQYTDSPAARLDAAEPAPAGGGFNKTSSPGPPPQEAAGQEGGVDQAPPGGGAGAPPPPEAAGQEGATPPQDAGQSEDSASVLQRDHSSSPLPSGEPSGMSPLMPTYSKPIDAAEPEPAPGDVPEGDPADAAFEAQCEPHGDACTHAMASLSRRLGRPREHQRVQDASPYMWHWQSNRQADTWEPYDADTALRLEHEYQRRSRSCQVGGGRVVDFSGMGRNGDRDAVQRARGTRPVRRALWYSRDPSSIGGFKPAYSGGAEPRDGTAGYVRGWVECLKNNYNAKELFTLVASGMELGVSLLAREAIDSPNFVWDGRAWFEAFEEARKVKNYGGTKSLRVLVMRTTLKALEERRYLSSEKDPSNPDLLRGPTPLPLGQLLRPAHSTQKHDNVPTIAPDYPRHPLPESGMPAEVTSTDCIEVGLQLQDDGFNPVVLNMANAFHPGGGYLSGAGAQEENLCRRTAYCIALEAPDPLRELIETGPAKPISRHYPFRDTEGSYTPNVAVLRAAEDKGYDWLPQPRFLSFVAVAAIDRPRLTRDGRRLDPYARDLSKHKIRTILRIAHFHGHDAVVLSALGCGAFRNPPADVAAAFDEVLREDEFAGAFKKVLFAILDDQNAGRAHNPDGNFLPFKRRFDPSHKPTVRFELAKSGGIRDRHNDVRSDNKVSMRFVNHTKDKPMALHFYWNGKLSSKPMATVEPGQDWGSVSYAGTQWRAAWASSESSGEDKFHEWVLDKDGGREQVIHAVED